MYNMDFNKSNQMTNKLIDIMIADGLSVAEMTVVADCLSEDLKEQIGELHIAPDELLRSSVQ